jgi:hypothetical protein
MAEVRLLSFKRGKDLAIEGIAKIACHWTRLFEFFSKFFPSRPKIIDGCTVEQGTMCRLPTVKR